MRWLLAAVVLLAVSQLALAADEQQQATPSWIKGESKNWPKWGGFKLRWLARERREAIRDKTDAGRELGVVRSWARSYVASRVGELVAKATHRVTECKHFKTLWKIRADNHDFHRGAHRRNPIKRRKHSKRSPWYASAAEKPKRKVSPKKKGGKLYYFRKFSLHARMLIASRDRLRAAVRARQRCWATVKKLRTRRPVVEKKVRSVARGAVLRAKAHVQRTADLLKTIEGKIAKQKRRIAARVAKYKSFYFHRCKRVKGHKYNCMYSIRHGGTDHARRPFRFFKCLWNNSNGVVVRHVCWK